ncbi:MAG: hypothetical protein HC784_04750 [Hydrococcus sp. CSU_1_8]|nr:hypothetical protein [Hydrococcus sp. CSU_1_8]
MDKTGMQLEHAQNASKQARAASEALELSRAPHLLISPAPHPGTESGVHSRGNLYNFGLLPVHFQGGWIEEIGATRPDRGDIRLLSNTLGHGLAQTPFLEPRAKIELEFQDYVLRTGWYVVRIMFVYPTFPNRTLLFDVLMRKVDHNRIYYVDNVDYVLEPYTTEAPPTRLRPMF